MKALITGINGQTGSFLAELLLEKGYEVHGIVRRNSTAENQTYRINHIINDLHLYHGDLLDISSLYHIIKQSNPDEIYNLAAQSHVKISFEIPQFTCEVNSIGFLNLLEVVKNYNRDIKVLQASSSEMFGNSADTDAFQRITTPMKPISPYGNSKLFSYNLSRIYRESYNMFICNSISFNHESHRRGTNFVTQKVVHGAVRITRGFQDKLILGNLNACRDWSHAKDIVKAQNLIMIQDTSNDFVVSSGVSHSIRELCEYVFAKVGLHYDEWVKSDESFYRPNELNYLRGDSSPIKQSLNWKPDYTFETLLDEMIKKSEAWNEK